MAEDSLHYDQMVESALRGVLRQALTVASASGLPGDHHFYITFRTDHPGVTLSEQLRARHPTEITIVLQHQFWGLEVREDSFDVTLSFSNVPETLTVPFEAVTAFADPSVRFGLQFNAAEILMEGEAPPDQTPPPDQDPTEDAAAPDKVVTLDAFRKK